MTGQDRSNGDELEIDLDFLSDVEDVPSELAPDETEEVVEGADEPEPSTSLGQAERERDEYLDALRRLQAEFDNYRKRVLRQQTELLERATESLLERLLPVLDALDQAIALGQSKGEAADELANALVRIGALLRETLAKEGLERIDEVEVEFDPTVHDAVAHVPDDDREVGAEQPAPSHVIDEIMRPGYRQKGRVIRPAMVRVRG